MPRLPNVPCSHDQSLYFLLRAREDVGNVRSDYSQSQTSAAAVRTAAPMPNRRTALLSALLLTKPPLIYILTFVPHAREVTVAAITEIMRPRWGSEVNWNITGGVERVIG